MKLHLILIAFLMFTGCRRPAHSAPPITENASPGSQPQATSAGHERGEGKEADRDYAKGIVVLKTGDKVAGQILLQCPGYLTVCFKINSDEPGSSQLVPNEDVRSVFLEESWDHIDPLWRELREEMTIVTEQSNVRNRHKQ